MRQGQHNKNNRQRGRNRRPQGNPANRVYDSHGPDVRVRGSAQTVADKYLQLAADAQSASDYVRAESYFQHAEHYLRIVAANQQQRQQKIAEREEQAAQRAAEREAERQARKEKAAQEADAVETDDEAGEANGKDAPANSDEDAATDAWGGNPPAYLAPRDDEDSTEAKPKKTRRRSPKAAEA